MRIYYSTTLFIDQSLITDVHINIYGLVLVETSNHVEDGPVTRSIIELLE